MGGCMVLQCIVKKKKPEGDSGSKIWPFCSLMLSRVTQKESSIHIYIYIYIYIYICIYMFTYF